MKLLGAGFTQFKIAKAKKDFYRLFRRNPRISDGDPNLLNANRNDNGQWLNTAYDNPENRGNSDNGFAFALPQVQSSASDNKS